MAFSSEEFDSLGEELPPLQNLLPPDFLLPSFGFVLGEDSEFLLLIHFLNDT